MEQVVKILRFNAINIPINDYSVVLDKNFGETRQLINFDILNTNFKNITGDVKDDVLHFSLPDGESFLPTNNDYSVKINGKVGQFQVTLNGTTTLEVPVTKNQEKSIYDYCVKDAPLKIQMGQATPFLMPQFGFEGTGSSQYLSMCFRENYNKENFVPNTVASTFTDLASMQSNCYNHECENSECIDPSPQPANNEVKENNNEIVETFCAGCKTTIDPVLIIVAIFFGALLVYLLSQLSKK